MALDGWTLDALSFLATKWDCSKAEVMRRAVRKAKQEADLEDKLPTPLQALDWLQDGGGLKVAEAEAFREEVQAERQGRRYWWEP
jgi:Arc/MetJ-type ribon-helix-helix transcriptional regulator